MGRVSLIFAVWLLDFVVAFNCHTTPRRHNSLAPHKSTTSSIEEESEKIRMLREEGEARIAKRAALASEQEAWQALFEQQKIASESEPEPEEPEPAPVSASAPATAAMAAPVPSDATTAAAPPKSVPEPADFQEPEPAPVPASAPATAAMAAPVPSDAMTAAAAPKSVPEPADFIEQITMTGGGETLPGFKNGQFNVEEQPPAAKARRRLQRVSKQVPPAATMTGSGDTKPGFTNEQITVTGGGETLPGFQTGQFNVGEPPAPRRARRGLPRASKQAPSAAIVTDNGNTKPGFTNEQVTVTGGGETLPGFTTRKLNADMKEDRRARRRSPLAPEQAPSAAAVENIAAGGGGTLSGFTTGQFNI